MSFYNLSYDQKAVELLPPDKRAPAMVQWVQALLKQLQYNQSSIFTDFKVDADYPVYVAGSYNKFDRVIYGQSVYESLTDANTAVPTDANYWRLYQIFFTGTDTRIKYNGQKLVLEYAINDRFMTTFRQPPLVSDIYFSTNIPVPSVFVIGGIEENSSVTYNNNSSEYLIDGYSFSAFYNFTLYIPTAIYNAVSADVNAREPIFRNYINNLLPAGVTYTIQLY